MKKAFIILLVFSAISNLIAQTPKQIYADFYQAKKYYSLDKFYPALESINRFQQTKSFDTYAARVKLKILHQLNSRKLVDEFFKMVVSTGIETEDLVYNALKTKKDSTYFLVNYPKEKFKKKYNESRRAYLNQLTEPDYSIGISLIDGQDRGIRLGALDTFFVDTALRNIYDQELTLVDSWNYYGIKELINKYGLPTHDKIGYNQYYLVLMAAMHICVNPDYPDAFAYFENIFKKTVMLGQMNPEYYMYFRDAVSRKTKGCQIYGYLVHRDSLKRMAMYPFCNHNKKYIDKLRYEIGAGSVIDACRYEKLYCNWKVKK